MHLERPVVEAISKIYKLGIFITYSREDVDFADQLEIALSDAGFNATLDRLGIPGAAEWKRRLSEMIQAADAVVFVLSPSSARSKECAWEVDEASSLGKRIIPVLCKPLDGYVPPAQLASLNYIYFYAEPKVPTSGFGSGLTVLKGVLNEDADWLREHTRLLKLAQNWVQVGGARDALLAGKDVTNAEAWLRRRPGQAPALSELHKSFIAESARVEILATSQRNLSRTRWAAGLLLLLFAFSALVGGLYFKNYQRTVIADLEKQKADHKAQLDQLRADARRELRSIAADSLKRIVKAKTELGPAHPTRAVTVVAEPPASPDKRISQVAIDFILLHEVGGEEGYRRRHSRVQRPLNNSGVTIGIGYDLKFVKERQLRAVWRELPRSHLDRLARLASKSGMEAEAQFASVQDIEIPFIIARKVYEEHTLADAGRRMERIYPQAVILPPDCYGALLSIVLNRGNDLTERTNNQSDSRDEMRAIAKLLELGEFAAIPDQIRSMKWLWWMSERNDVKGLPERREAEAQLFEIGLHSVAPGKQPAAEPPRAAD